MPGLQGVLLVQSHSGATARTTTINFIDPFRADRASWVKVGLHFDAYVGAERDHLAMVANLGPDPRYHAFIADPSLTRDSLRRTDFTEVPTEKRNLQHELYRALRLRQLLGRLPLVYMVRIDAGEALCGLPVTEVIHDGAIVTKKIDHRSRGVLASIDQKSSETFGQTLLIEQAAA